jgi:predicted NBD/HSP70 family sugar kinase
MPKQTLSLQRNEPVSGSTGEHEKPIRPASENERLILDLLRRHRGASRAELARLTGLTNQTLSRLIEELGSMGLVKLGEAQIKGRGQPSHPVLICPEGAYTIGLSIMTDALSLCLMDFDGKIIRSQSLHFPSNEVGRVLAMIHRFIDESLDAFTIDRTRLVGVGVAITGFFIGTGLQVNPPAPLDNWALTDVKEMLEAHLNLPVWLDNDGSVAAVGEAISGVGIDFSSFAYLFFSAGFGGGLILDRKLHRGTHGNAGEFNAILPPDYTAPNLNTLLEDLRADGMTFADIAEMLDVFDVRWAGVNAWLDKVIPSLNLVIGAISAVTDVETIVLGGRLPKSLGEILIERLSFHNTQRRGHYRPVPRLLTSGAREDAALIGAASLPLKALYYG